jgi:peptidoglycan/xylan/chitin deacetylase (PgdA/CDA1 family)
LRASGYEAKELADTICKLRAAGCEVGLHGIDAWVDTSSGREELEEIRRLTGDSEIGVRMHWLYYDEKSPAVLESAEAAYDSTIGYNETVGYRAGTTQAYKPLAAERMLELPLHVMDTALFYLSYLGLSPRKASARLRQMADNAVRFGGTLTINWHDRSLAPERLWGGCYRDLIQDLKSRGAWFSTAGQAVAWFRKRRSAGFETDPSEPCQVRAKVSGDHRESLPRLRLRIHNPRKSSPIGAHRSEDFVDMAVDEGTETFLASESRR